MGLLEGKAAIVTGAGRGVGQGCALAMAREGCSVLITEPDEANLRNTLRIIADFGGTARGCVADATKADDVIRSIEEAVQWFSGLDIVVNSAFSNQVQALILDTTDDDFLAKFNLGPMAVLRYMRAAYPHLKARGGGVFINVISGAVVESDAKSWGSYAAVKSAIASLTRSAACEWGADNIRCISMAPIAASPGFTAMEARDPDQAKKVRGKIPLGRPGRIEEDIGRGVVALCSDHSAFMTGCTIPLDGGTSYFH